MVSIKIAGTVDESVVDGEGIRFTIFTQGCPHKCEGCHNPHTHDYTAGKNVTIEKLFTEICENPLLQGVTFSGGEPFLQPEPLATLAKMLHKKGFDVTTYTGYTLEELQAMNSVMVNALLDETDVLIDGKFIIAERDLTLQFRGSRNQRLIDMKQTREQGKIIRKEFN